MTRTSTALGVAIAAFGLFVVGQGGRLNINKFLKSGETEADKSKKFVCGLPAFAPFENHPTANIGKARPNSWPWHVSVRFRSHHHCSGAVISRRHVLTSAHCFSMFSRDPVDYEVWVGKHSREEMEIGHEQTIAVEEILLHPDHAIRSVYDADLALVKLVAPGAWINTNYTMPICLEKPLIARARPYAYEDVPNCYVTGYRLFAKSPADQLKQAKVPIISIDRCGRFNRNLKNYLTESVFCSDKATPDSCSTADTGSPLVCKSETTMSWWVVGIASSGIECSMKAHSPVVFSRVANYLNWITDVAFDANNIISP